MELTRTCLERIGRLDPELNAFITVTADLALEQARTAEAEINAGGWRGPLHGIPIALKDLIDVAGVRTTAASNQLRNHVASKDAGVITQLKRAGAVIVGKTNLHEFAFGGSGMVSAFGPVKNPWDLKRITGGSSSGSAAAVAAGLCVAAMGTDTAGSVRDPAALCGIVGHRPSEGVFSTEGIIPLRKSFDVAGPMTRTVEDAWLMLRALAANGSQFSAAELDLEVGHVAVGVAREGFFDGLEAEVSRCVEAALAVIRSLVRSMGDVKLELGVKWTSFDAEILEYHHKMLADTPELYQPGTLERLRACAAIPREEFAQAVSELATSRRRAEELFATVDVVVTPTVLVAAPTIADLDAMTSVDLRAFEVQKLLHNTAPFSLLFWPSVSVPCGFTSKGLPVGMQISSRPGADDLALRVARAYEQATDWHKRAPAIAA